MKNEEGKTLLEVASLLATVSKKYISLADGSCRYVHVSM